MIVTECAILELVLLQCFGGDGSFPVLCLMHLTGVMSSHAVDGYLRWFKLGA